MRQDTSDYYDGELEKFGALGLEIQRKYSTRPRTEHWVQEFEKEAHERFADLGWLVHVGFDQENNLPTIELVMRVSGSIERKEGLDHERKAFEVKRSKSRGEDYLGQKE